MVIAVTGVMLLAVAAFLVSYAGLRQIAVAAGVSPALAGLYPLIVDAVLVVACVAALALRGAGWQLQGCAWLSVMVLFAVVAVAGAVHAAGVGLPHRPAAAAVAALPWGLFLLGFGLCLSVLRHLRAVRAAGPPGDRGAAPWWPWTADPHTADAAALPAQPEPASSGAIRKPRMSRLRPAGASQLRRGVKRPPFSGPCHLGQGNWRVAGDCRSAGRPWNRTSPTTGGTVDA